MDDEPSALVSVYTSLVIFVLYIQPAGRRACFPTGSGVGRDRARTRPTMVPQPRDSIKLTGADLALQPCVARQPMG